MLPDLHRQLQGKRTQLTSTAAPDIVTATGRTFITDQSSKRRFLNNTGSPLCVFPRKLIPQRRSRIHYVQCAANGTTILTNLGWRRDHTPSNPASQDTGDERLGERLTLGASNIAQRFEGQVPGTIISTYCDTPAGQPRPYISASLRLQVFHHYLRLHRPDHAFRSPPTLPRTLQHLRNNLAQGDGLVTTDVTGSSDAKSKNQSHALVGQ
jgi:hypothetical protein